MCLNLKAGLDDHGGFSNLNESVILLLIILSKCPQKCLHLCVPWTATPGVFQQCLQESLCEMGVTPARNECGHSYCSWLGCVPQDTHVPRELLPLYACSEAEKLQLTTTVVGLCV